jgi:peptidyl-prolyl cis-trans isomerase C
VRLYEGEEKFTVRSGRQKGTMMRKISKLQLLTVTLLLVFWQMGANPRSAGAAATPVQASGALAEVNGVKFTKSQFDGEMKRKLATIKNQMPADRLQKIMPEIKKQIIDDFVIRTLLSQEVKRQKISASEQEITEATERVKTGLPPGASLDDLLKKNEITKDKFREEVTLGVKINKLVLSQPLALAKPSDKEIAKYYQDNKEKFKAPETVHARHILIGKKTGDDEKTKAEKKAKAELLRKQLVDGGDFADLAAKNSDCPSKTSGGDLGSFSRGQMVKPFEDAAFSQKVNAIGPVVETDFGYHIIQVLAHNEAKVISLDKKIKDEIGTFLQQQKRQEAFNEMLKKLRTKATIIVAGQ